MAKAEDLSELKEKVLTYIGQAYLKYSQFATAIAESKERLQQHEFLCYATDQHACVKQHDAFKPTLFARERAIAKKFRSCVNQCREKAPHLLDLGSYEPASLQELQTYEAASKCFSQCIDVVSPEFTSTESAIMDRTEKLSAEYNVDK